MSSWKQVRFSEICDITRGGSPRPIQEYMTNDGVPWIKISDATASNSRFIEKTKEFIKTSGISKSREVFPGDLILSNSATPGIPKFMKIYACIHDGWLLLRNFNGAEKEFIYWLLLNERDKLIQQGNGSVFTNLKTDILKNHIVNIPDDIEEQKRIATILNNIQEKIELNTQINQTLEQIAQTIFKSWFIDFDPVHAKANALASGQTLEQATQAAMAVISGKNTQELHRLQTANPEQYQQLWEIAEAFPSGFDEEGVPRGWGLSTIDENYNVVMGQSPKGETYNEESNGALFYQGRAEFGWRHPEPRLYTTDPKRMAKKGNILMSVRAPVGDLNVALEDCCIGRGLAALSHKSNSLSFGLYQIKNLQNEFDIFNGEGTVFGSINQKDLKAIKVINPSFKIIKLFDDVCSSNELQIENLSREIIFLRKIRDELLPKLLSGEKKYVCE
ncbi:restriction endonuclease subunit S [Glaesserella parasuis]|nr:restriction endonuclease subunit S [Glaesserella parasuis]